MTNKGVTNYRSAFYFHSHRKVKNSAKIKAHWCCIIVYKTSNFFLSLFKMPIYSNVMAKDDTLKGLSYTSIVLICTVVTSENL